MEYTWYDGFKLRVAPRSVNGAGRSPRSFGGRSIRRGHSVPANGQPAIYDLCKVLFQEVENLSPAVLIHDDPVVTAIEYNVLKVIVESLSVQTAHDLLAHEGGWPETISLTRN